MTSFPERKRAHTGRYSMVQIVGLGELQAVLTGTEVVVGATGLGGDMSASSSAQPTNNIKHMEPRYIGMRLKDLSPWVGRSLPPW